MRRLIAVEGLPGSGKTTFAQALAYGLERAGHRVRWFTELEVDHPLAPPYAPDRFASVETYLSECLERWRAFVESIDGIAIVDAWLLQDAVFGLLLADVARSEILRVMGELFAALPVHETTFVRLIQRDVAAAVEALCAGRGDAMGAFYLTRNDRSAFARARGVSGMSGLVRFWSEHRDLCESVLAGSSARRIDVDVSDRNFARATAELFSAFGLDLPPPARSDDLGQFAGRYALDDSGRSFEVVVESGSLTLRDFPFFWSEVDTALVRLHGDVFAVQSWPSEVEFHVEGGVARSLTVRELHHCGQPPFPGGTYERANESARPGAP